MNVPRGRDYTKAFNLKVKCTEGINGYSPDAYRKTTEGSTCKKYLVAKGM